MFNFLNDWKELIIAFLKNYPFVGAVLGAIAIYAYFQLKKTKVITQNQYLNIFIAFGCWVILVPVVGFIFNIFGKLWSYIEVTFPFIINIISKIYSIYEKHSILVLSIMAIGFLSYLIWNKWWQDRIKNAWLKVLIIIFSVIISIFILAPIADLFSSKETNDNSDTKTKKDLTEMKINPLQTLTKIKINLQDSILNLNSTWMNSFMIRDSIGISKNYTDSTQGFFTGYHSMLGKDSLLSFWMLKRNNGIQQIKIDMTGFKTEDMCIIAFENGTYTFFTDSGLIAEEGEYLIIWRKQNGQWKHFKDVWLKNL